MGFDNFIKVNLSGQIYISTIDNDKTKRKY